MSEKIQHLDGLNFRSFVDQEGQTALVDFWAPWCGPCRALAPELDALAQEMNGQVLIGKVNVDEEIELAEQFGIQSIPTLILFKNGEAVTRMVGFKNKKALKEVIEKFSEISA